MQTSPEICYECSFFRTNTGDGSYLCINPDAYWCDRQGIGKATRACHHGRLNPKLPQLYPDRYAMPTEEDDPTPPLVNNPELTEPTIPLPE